MNDFTPIFDYFDDRKKKDYHPIFGLITSGKINEKLEFACTSISVFLLMIFYQLYSEIKKDERENSNEVEQFKP